MISMLKIVSAAALLLFLGVAFMGASLPQSSEVESIHNIRIFSVPGSTNTVATGVDNDGAIIGTFDDANGLHAFIRTRTGHFITFDAPSATLTLGFDINNAGTAVGSFINDSGSTDQIGYIRSKAGSFLTFTVPGNDGDLSLI